MNEEKYSRMSISQILDKSIYIHKKHMGTLALYLFVMSILIIVIGLIFSFILLMPTTMLITSSIILGNGTPEVSFYLSMSIIIIILTMFYYFLEGIKQSGIIVIGSNGFLRKTADISQAMEGTLKNILRVLSVVLAGTIMFLPIVAVFGGILVVFVLNYDGIGSTASVIGIILTSIVLIATFAYFMTIHIFSIQSAIIEKLYFFKALKRSRQLVRGRFWKTLGSVVIASLVVTFINISIYTVFGLIGGAIYLILKSAKIHQNILAVILMLESIVRIPIQMLVSFFVTPISGIFITILYYNMRFQKEGFDIALNVIRLKKH